VDPVGRGGERALAFYLRVLAAGRRGDRQPPAAPTALTASELTQTAVRLHWQAAEDLHGVTAYGLYRDGIAVGRSSGLSAPITGLQCATRYRLEVDAADAAGNRSAKASLALSTQSCTEPSPLPLPLPPSSPFPGQPSGLVAPDGGLGFYGRFSNSLPTSADWFPLAVWGSYAHEPVNIAKDKAVGLNTYVWVADSAFIEDVRAAGMRVIQAEDTRSGVGVESAGWLLSDEIDMTVGPSACPTLLDPLRAGVAGDGRFIFDNYGKGVMFWQSDAEAACFANYDDVNSSDIYWMTDSNVCTSSSEGPRFFGLTRALTDAECRRAANYGYVVDKMRRLDALDGVRHPIWNFVEVGCPFDNNMCISPAQARAAVWHSLIAGARGILYFNHSFSGEITHHVLRDERYQAMIDTITAVNQQIVSIAPALNGPSLATGFAAAGGARATARWDGRNFYVLAGSKENVASTAGFAIPCVGNATATVLGESRSIPVTAGAFSDGFADGNAVHIYRIDGGSTCGLD
jgi:hypothetical protein